MLDPPDATSDQAGVPLLDEDYLILSTIHSAKGQEWKSVCLLNVVDGCMPSDLGAGTSAEIEEERRLLYVAMTRAKDGLHLVVPQRLFVHGQHAQAIVTSMPPGRASFPKSCSVCSSGPPGLLCRPVPRHAPSAKDPRWISALACGECGDRRQMRNGRVQPLFDHDQPGHYRSLPGMNPIVGNLPRMPGMFRDYPAPVVRNAGAGCELVMIGHVSPSKFGQMPSALHLLALQKSFCRSCQRLQARLSCRDLRDLVASSQTHMVYFGSATEVAGIVDRFVF
jgi:UvrD-like helicase C-terminal domain